ncbi:MAG: hypothetical protein EOP87_13190 [Verrucomicrobiaceae bacterium]|nr:MAG: hypothetical protein EOP87_13190 [Verrucomicrobiaceae bacterium]
MNFPMKYLIPLQAALMVSAHAAGPGNTNDFRGKRVLIIGIDGLLPSALKAAGTTHLRQLMDEGTTTFTGHSGGTPGTPTEQPTLSGPAWTTMMTATYADVHGVRGNTSSPYGTPGGYQVERAPHFAKRLKEIKPTASVGSIASWGWIEDYLVAAQPSAFDLHSKGEGKNYAEKDLDVSRKSVDCLLGGNPDVLFVHFDQVDGAGHASGFKVDNPTYLEAVRVVDTHVGALLAALKKRPRYALEDWLIIATTDHGGTSGGAHGGQSPEERTIFIILSGGGYPKGQVVESKPGLHVIPGITFRHLGMPVEPRWEWHSEPSDGTR